MNRPVKIKPGNHYFARYLDKVNEQGLEGFGKFYSIYRAFVVSNQDPKNLQRLKLIIPDLTGELIYDYWCPPRGVYFGKGYGTQVLPQKGDLVWLEFEQGNPECPVWSHGYPALTEPPEDSELTDKSAFWFKSPKGHCILINDTNGTIYAKHSSGNSALINEKGVSLISDKAISLGSKDNSNEPALLGDKTEDVLNDIKDILNTIAQALVIDTTASASSSSPFMLYTNLTTAAVEALAKVQGLSAKIELIKSNKVTLD